MSHNSARDVLSSEGIMILNYQKGESGLTKTKEYAVIGGLKEKMDKQNSKCLEM